MSEAITNYNDLRRTRDPGLGGLWRRWREGGPKFESDILSSIAGSAILAARRGGYQPELTGLTPDEVTKAHSIARGNLSEEARRALDAQQDAQLDKMTATRKQGAFTEEALSRRFAKGVPGLLVARQMERNRLARAEGQDQPRIGSGREE